MVGVGCGPGEDPGGLHDLADRGDRKTTVEQVVSREDERNHDTSLRLDANDWPGESTHARLLAVRPYYEARAAEYDATTYELALRDPANARDLATLKRLVADLPPGRTLDIGCGTGWLTRFLRGNVVALDQSEAMLDKARERLGNTVLVLAAVPP